MDSLAYSLLVAYVMLPDDGCTNHVGVAHSYCNKLLPIVSTLGTNRYVNLVGKERLLGIGLTIWESVMLQVFITTMHGSTVTEWHVPSQ